MKAVRSNFTILVLMLVALLGAGCRGNAEMSSPLGPSSSSTAASISGTINGAPVALRSLDPGGFSLLDSRGSGVTITVAGTGISTTANNQGQFTLDNVPPGTVTLSFTGPNSNATVTLTGVSAGDKVTITVTVNGSNAHVDSEQHSHGNGGEFEGRITAIDTGAKSFTASGMTIKLTDTTVIRHGNKTLQLADLKVGNHVQVRGTRDGTTITATEVKVEDDENDDDQGEDNNRGSQPGQADVNGLVSESTGTCPAVSFKVGTTPVTVDTNTRYDGTTCAVATKNGAKVELNGTRQSNGSILATKVEIDD